MIRYVIITIFSFCVNRKPAPAMTPPRSWKFYKLDTWLFGAFQALVMGLVTLFMHLSNVKGMVERQVQTLETGQALYSQNFSVENVN